jgi:hypothetical protein
MTKEVREKYMRELEGSGCKGACYSSQGEQDELFAKMRGASAVKAYQKRGLPLAPGMEIGYVVTDAAK